MTDPRFSERSATERCPSRALLMCALEGELTPEERFPLLSHLNRCDACQRDLAYIEPYVELAAASIDRSFDRIGARIRSREFSQALHRQKQALIHATTGWRSIVRWMPLAAVVPVLVFAFILTSSQTIVRADELVTLAAASEHAQPPGLVRRVRITSTPTNPALLRGAPASIRLRSSVTVRNVSDAGLFDLKPVSLTSTGTDATLAHLLAAHHFDIERPLAIAGFQAWRASLTQRRDHVSPSGELFVVLHTTATEGTLREAYLRVRRDTFRVVGLTLVFEGIGRIDIEEVEPPVQRVFDSTTVSADAPPIAAWYGAPRAPAHALVAVPTETIEAAAPAPEPGLSRWLERSFGEGPGRTTFIPELLRRLAAVKDGLRALRSLAPQYARAEIARLSAAERAVRDQLLQTRYSTLTSDLEALDESIGTLTRTTRGRLPAPHPPADWSRRATEALRHAEALDRLIADLLSHDDMPPDATGPQSQHPIVSTFAALWNAISAAEVQPARH